MAPPAGDVQHLEAPGTSEASTELGLARHCLLTLQTSLCNTLCYSSFEQSHAPSHPAACIAVNTPLLAPTSSSPCCSSNFDRDNLFSYFEASAIHWTHQAITWAFLAIMDPEEVAFLQNINSIGEADYAPSAENTQPAQAVDEDDEEDYDPSALMPDDSFPDDSEPASQPANSTHSPAVHDTLSRLPSEAIGKVTATPTQSRPSSALPDQQSAPHPDANKQPRTVGGFIVDDDEDEDVDNETPFPPFQRTSRAGTNGLLAVAQSTSTPQRSVSRTPNNITSSNVQNKNDTQDQGVSDFAPNGSSNAVSPATPIPNPNLSQQSNDQNTHNISAPVSYLLANASISSQKARLPNDRVGILEDRIAEDPRGDTSAWLTLIDEYRNREKFEEVRAVYDRFLRLFPSAVSDCPHLCEALLTTFRAINGMRTRKWNLTVTNLGKRNKSSRGRF